MLLQQLLGLIWIIREFKVRPAQINPMESLLNFFFKSRSLGMGTFSNEAEVLLVFGQPGDEVWSAVRHELDIRLPFLRANSIQANPA